MNESVRRANRRGLAGRAGGILVVLLVFGLLTPVAANATWTAYRQGAALCGGCQDADATRSALTASYVSTNDPGKSVQAGAHQPGGWNLYGGWVQGVGNACHTYSGQNIGAMARNPHSVTISGVWAHAGWVENGQGSYC